MVIHWNGWHSLGKPEVTDLAQPFVHRNQDGRLEVFALGDGELFNIAQLFPNAGWRAEWLNKGNPAPNVAVLAHVLGRNADGRLELFALGADKRLWQKWQLVPNGGWSEWKAMDRPAETVDLTDRFVLGRNRDGRQEAFALAADGNIWQIWQTAPNGGWSAWKKLGAPAPGLRASDRISVGHNEDGRQELFVMGIDGAVWHVWQEAPNAGWSGWASLGRARDRFDSSEPAKDRELSQPVVQDNADGHLEVLAPGDGAFCNRWQEIWRSGPNQVVWRHQGWNQKPKPRSDVALTRLESARNFEQRLEAIGFGDDGALWHAWQIDTEPFWSKWESLGSPPAEIDVSDRLGVGTNQDGRLEVFLVGRDGSIRHTWQVRG